MITVCCVAIVAGAVYSPAWLIVPTPVGLIVHVTAVLLLLLTLAVNCCACPLSSVALAGVTLTDTGRVAAAGTRVIVAEADLVGSAWLVAVIVTVCCKPTAAGAVYNPAALIVPTPAGMAVQVTAVLLVLATLAVNCCVWPPLESVTLAGVTLKDTGGMRVTVAVSDVDETPRVVAVIVTVCCVSILEGAV